MGRSPAINVSLRLWQGEASGVNTLQRNLFKVVRNGFSNMVRFRVSAPSLSKTPRSRGFLCLRGMPLLEVANAEHRCLLPGRRGQAFAREEVHYLKPVFILDRVVAGGIEADACEVRAEGGAEGDF